MGSQYERTLVGVRYLPIMKRVKFILVLSLLSRCSSAPTDDMAACMQITNEDSASMATCCDYVIPFSNKTMTTCDKKETSGEMSKEFECVQDCLFSSDNVLGADKKFDPVAWRKHATNTISGDWKGVIANSGSNCEGFKKVLAQSMEKKCPTSESDVSFNCMTLQWYMNCPKSAWTSSESCEASKKKLMSCFGPIFENTS
uniref:Odorant binding protein 11 n=1 Tax=Apolygus lucorum TaxID=248454 RepID=I2BJA6_APOLU|nr:odorant binding protein 11 [Apolygus lucorum]